MTSPETAEAIFTVLVHPSARSFATIRGETVLSAGIRQGIALPYGCKDGACGSCKCKLISGSVQHGTHQDKALSQEEEANGMVLTCCATATSDLVLESRQVTELGALPIKKMPTRVSSMVKASHDVMVLQLQLPANETFNYRAGQYLEFILRDGVRRSYSMASAPQANSKVELHIRHMPGGKFTDHVFGELKERDILRVEGPFGSFFLREDSKKPMVFLASGTGFAPIKALIEQLISQGSARPVTFYWGARRPEDLYMHQWVLEQLPKLPQLRYVPVVSDATTDDAWTGRTGFVHHAVLQDFPDLSAHQVYACGAPIVVESAQKDFTQLCQLPMEEFFADSFTSEADKVQS